MAEHFHSAGDEDVLHLFDCILVYRDLVFGGLFCGGAVRVGWEDYRDVRDYRLFRQDFT